uniref:NADH-ubiquinone oxidoreductase chain 3 n=1 Tax=Sclerophasma paresisense TaxID=253126 RepID=Q2Q1I9_9NEOP|nr:NADH dehydrogenase subunit 3 [Sclerophasma paresisense]ABB81897.1 NADH dehydrogenase subunit 3 [Sclerophasma paresisense]
MMNTLYLMMIIVMLATIVMMLSSTISKKSIIDREKSSPFECGFEPMNKSRLPFSLRFFLIAVMFLIFDVEIALLLPMPILLLTSPVKTWMITGMIFIMILLMGLYYEWNQGMLKWAE